MLADVEAGMESAITHYREHGYTISAGEWMTDYFAVGVPLALRNGKIFAFNCGGLAGQIGRDKLPELGRKLAAMVADLAQTPDAGR
jgi:DNA-binding IclR family transcriptional regulator